jgi:hypothetical protein
MNTYQIGNRKVGKIPFLLWIFSIVTLGIFAVAGLYQREFLGYIALGFLPVGIIFIISIIFTYYSNNDSLLLAKAGWTGLSILPISTILFLADTNQPNIFKETGLIVGYSMGILSFPSSLIILLLVACFYYLQNNYDFTNMLFLKNFYFSIFVFWAVLFVGGYYQWFKLIPKIISKFRKGGGSKTLWPI